MMKGGVVPGGSERSCTWLMRVDLGNCGTDVDVRLKEDLDDRDAVERLRLDVLNVVDGGGHAAFAVAGDAVGHLFGGEAGELPHHADYGDIDIGKDIRRHREDAEGANQEQEYGKDGKGIRPP